MGRSMPGLAASLVMVSVLAGCAPHPMESQLLRDAVESGQTDVQAAVSCATQNATVELVAALDSTSAQVREVGRQVDTFSGWDKHLPPDPDNYIAICIYDTAGVDVGLTDDPDYLAFWIGEGGNTGGTGILTKWRTDSN
jgi:hypothetical protein